MVSCSPSRKWFELINIREIASPALLVFRARVEENVRRMLNLCRAAERLRPHIKTHKMREVLELQLSLGVTRFKCATIPEAEMAPRLASAICCLPINL